MCISLNLYDYPKRPVIMVPFYWHGSWGSDGLMYLVTLSMAIRSCNSQNASQDLLPRSALFLLSTKSLRVVFISAYTEPINTLPAMDGAQWCAWICKHPIELPLLSFLWGVFSLLLSIQLQPHYSDGSHLPLPQVCLSSYDDIHSDYFYHTKAIINSNVMNNISISSQECLVSPILSPSQGCEHL